MTDVDLQQWLVVSQLQTTVYITVLHHARRQTRCHTSPSIGPRGVPARRCWRYGVDYVSALVQDLTAPHDLVLPEPKV